MDVSNLPERPDRLSEYDDEVLNAGWVPEVPAGDEPRSSKPARDEPHKQPVDPDSFLRAAYLYQR